MASELFSPEVVDAVARHMNYDHADDNVLIVRALGGQPAATEARVIGLDDGGVLFATVVEGTETTARVPWGTVPVERAHIRAEVVQMYQQACEVLGIPVREAAEH